jgi:hypothetical protein
MHGTLKVVAIVLVTLVVVAYVNPLRTIILKVPAA